MIVLPTSPLPANLDLTGNNILLAADYGMGKSGFLASCTDYILADPEDKLRTYPDIYRVTLPDWKAHLEFAQAISKAPKDQYKGIGLDSLNVSYTAALQWCMKNVKFAGAYLTHPSENPQIAYPRVTHEFITWLRSLTVLGYHVIGTCHVTVTEIRDKKGSVYNRWIPSFVGGAAESTYQQILKVFPLIGFMTLEDVKKPPTAMKMGKAAVDMRADASRLDEYEQKRVIHFDQSPYWLANNKFSGFPDTVILTNDYMEDWPLLLKAWGRAANQTAEEEVETELPIVGKESQAVGLGR